MKIFVTTDTHFGHKALADTFEARPLDFEDRIIRNWQRMIRPEDLVVHLGDVVVGKAFDWKTTISSLTGRKILVIGNHDKKTAIWYMKNGFDFCCSQFSWAMYGLTIILSHFPLANGSFDLNIHGHLHGGRHREFDVDQRHHLLSLEETGYQPRLLESIVKEWRKSNQTDAGDGK
jgi:calcineurin-like phosphoesterase family protein